MPRDLINIDRDQDGHLPAHAWPGGYPVFYLTADNSALCAECADFETRLASEIESTEWNGVMDVPVAWGIHYEGDPITCDGCGRDIDSAYGPLTEE